MNANAEQQPTATERFVEELLALTQRFEREQAAARRQSEPAPTVRDRLNDAGRKRRAWKAIEPELPALFAEASTNGLGNGRGLGPESIAGIVGVTPSYVYRKLREHRAAETDAPITGDAPPVDEHRLTTRDDQ
jgi:hypothetical protein